MRLNEIEEWDTGTKVRLPHWKEGRYLHFDDGYLLDSDFDYVHPTLIKEMVNSDEWEVLTKERVMYIHEFWGEESGHKTNHFHSVRTSLTWCEFKCDHKLELIRTIKV